MNPGDPTLGIHLDTILARSYVLYSDARYIDRHVRGKVRGSLGEVLRSHCIDLALAVDRIAERIHSLHLRTPLTLEQIARARSSSELPDPASYGQVLDHLIAGHEELIMQIREGLDAADRIADETTRELLVERRAAHVAAARLLRIRRGLRPESAMLLASPRLLDSFSVLHPGEAQAGTRDKVRRQAHSRAAGTLVRQGH